MDERRDSSLDDDQPGSQGEIESGSEGDFTGPDGGGDELPSDDADDEDEA